MKTPHSARGVTLISVMVSVAILAIALAMAASAFIGAARLTRQAADFARAGEFAEGVMERVRLQPFDSVRSVAVVKGLPDLPRARCEVRVTLREPALKEVTVMCSWHDDDRARNVRYCTLIAQSGSTP